MNKEEMRNFVSRYFKVVKGVNSFDQVEFLDPESRENLKTGNFTEKEYNYLSNVKILGRLYHELDFSNNGISRFMGEYMREQLKTFESIIKGDKCDPVDYTQIKELTEEDMYIALRQCLEELGVSYSTERVVLLASIEDCKKIEDYSPSLIREIPNEFLADNQRRYGGDIFNSEIDDEFVFVEDIAIDNYPNPITRVTKADWFEQVRGYEFDEVMEGYYNEEKTYEGKPFTKEIMLDILQDRLGKVKYAISVCNNLTRTEINAFTEDSYVLANLDFAEDYLEKNVESIKGRGLLVDPED